MLADNIRAYGVQAILGRVMYAREVLRCNAMANVYAIKTAAMKAENIAEWAKQNPHEAEALAQIEKLIEELEADA